MHVRWFVAAILAITHNGQCNGLCALLRSCRFAMYVGYSFSLCNAIRFPQWHCQERNARMFILVEIWSGSRILRPYGLLDIATVFDWRKKRLRPCQLIDLNFVCSLVKYLGGKVRATIGIGINKPKQSVVSATNKNNGNVAPSLYFVVFLLIQTGFCELLKGPAMAVVHHMCMCAAFLKKKIE